MSSLALAVPFFARKPYTFLNLNPVSSPSRVFQIFHSQGQYSACEVLTFPPHVYSTKFCRTEQLTARINQNNITPMLAPVYHSPLNAMPCQILQLDFLREMDRPNQSVLLCPQTDLSPPGLVLSSLSGIKVVKSS